MHSNVSSYFYRWKLSLAGRMQDEKKRSPIRGECKRKRAKCARARATKRQNAVAQMICEALN